MDDSSIFTCLGCGEQNHKRKNTHGKYCSNTCQQAGLLQKRASEWLLGKVHCTNRALRRILALLRGHKCEVCGISEWNSKKIVLEVEHKNGNSTDNSPQNVCLICPNCHSQTETYKGANRGNGRYYRRQRYAEGRSY